MKLTGKYCPQTIAGRLLCLLAMAAGLLSCERIFDDRSNCPRGLSLRFVYDHNMEFANSFHKKVDCVTLYVFDGEGNYMAEYTEQGDVLADEAWRMSIELDKGHYTLLAYGGLACEKSSFTATAFTRASGSCLEDMQVALGHSNFISDKQLHGLYYGCIDVDMEEDDYREEVLPMLKNTNTIRVMLQQAAPGTFMSRDDFTFEIISDNSLMDCRNSLVRAGDVSYRPWASGQETVGAWEDDAEVSMVYAEMSTARLTVDSAPRLLIRAVSDGRTVVDIPLARYLLMMKSEAYAEMPAQEFLDRQSEWSMIFFLDSGMRWLNTHIVVNGWVVRINDINGAF